MKHTKGPWFQLTGPDGNVIISNSAARHWASEEHYVGEVTKRNSNIVEAAPQMLDMLELASSALKGLFSLAKQKPSALVAKIDTIIDQALKEG